MFAVISRSCFYDEIEQATKSCNAEIIFKALGNDLDISAEVEKILRVRVKYLVLDIAAVEVRERIPAAIRKLRILKGDTRIIIVAPNMLPGNPIISHLVTMGIYDIINPKSNDDDVLSILPDLLECINKAAPYSKAVRWEVGASVTEGDSQDNKPPEKTKEIVTIIKDKIIGTIVIGVAGITAGIGCTHTSIAISGFLSMLKDNNKVAYLELNGSKHISSLNIGYDEALKPNSFTYNDVDFYDSSVTLSELIALKHYNYIVIDIGVLKFLGQNNEVVKNKYYDEFIRSSVPLLVCGSKPWHFKYIKCCLFNGSDSSDSLSWGVLYNFTDDKECKKISRIIKRPCYNMPYNTDYFSINDSNKCVFSDILKDVIPSSLPSKKTKRWGIFG